MPEQKWFENILFPIKNVFSRAIRNLTITPGELQAEALDNGDLEDFYEKDERKIHVYDGLRFSKERNCWVARFSFEDVYADMPYESVLKMSRTFHECRIKPSQSFKALRAFETKLDLKTIYPSVEYR